MAKMMINENMREEVIDAIAEWMADNTEFSADFLRGHGEDWLHVYTLDEMYRDYCGGDLADVINMFADNNVEASTWSDYFVDDNGDLHTDDEFSDVVSEMVFDDNKYAEWVLEEIEEELITEPQELMDIVSKYSATPWEDVELALDESFDMLFGCAKNAVRNADLSVSEFSQVCEKFIATKQVFDLFRRTRFCGLPEENYEEMLGALTNKAHEVNWLDDVVQLAMNNAVAGVSIEKATALYMQEVWFKN